MKEHDKFTQLLLQENKQKEKMWDDRFTLEKIPQFDAFKDPNYLSLGLLKTKNKIDEQNIKNRHSNIKKRIYSSHYSINSLNKKVATQANNKYENFTDKNSNNNTKSNLDKKRPHSIYLNRNHLSFMNGNNISNLKMNTNNKNDMNTNTNTFYNFFYKKLKTQNESSNISNNTNHYTKNLNSFNDKLFYKTTQNEDSKGKFIKFRERTYQNLDNDDSVIKKNKNLLDEFKEIKKIWNEICVTPEYQNSFEEMINNIDDKENIQNILNNEKKQITQFKNDFLKLMNVISKREATIEKIKKLDKIFLQNRNLAQFNKLFNEKSKSELNLKVDNDYGELEEKNKEQIENDINNCLKLLRINSVNAIHQFNKFRNMNNFLISSNKIDVNKLKSNYGFNKDYLIKIKNDLDFLASSNIKLIYDFKTDDPFLMNLIPEKSDSKFKKIPVSEELVHTINNYLYILAQEELLNKMNVKKDIKRNKSNGFEIKENKANNGNIFTKKNSKFNKNKNIKFLKLKTPKDYKIFFQHNTASNINNDKIPKKVKHIYIKNKSKEKEINDEKLSEIPGTTHEELQKKFEYYNKLKQDLTERSEKSEKIDNDDKKENNNNNDDNNMKQNNINKNEDKEGENNEYKYIWFNDTFNNFKSLYNEYYNKLSKNTIEIFSLNSNPDDLISGINPKIIICQKNTNNKIYGICMVSYYLDSNILILKINHLSALEKDEDESNNSDASKDKITIKIYKQLLEMIKTLSYEIIELNLQVNEQNKPLLDLFINDYKFEIKKEEEEKKQNENENNDLEENYKKITLRLYNNEHNDENIIKIKESNEIKYNNTSIISIINEDEFNNIDLEKEKDKDMSKLNINKFFYKFINTFNLNILLNYLTKDNIYTLTNTSNEKITSFSEEIPNYSSLFIKDKNNNIDNIISIIPDCSLIETNGKIKYAYITSIFNAKVFPFISTIFNKTIYNLYKIDLSKKNKEKKIYTINTSDEKIHFYIYQCEEESDLKKEINKNNNESFNIFEYFNQLINDNTKDENTDNKNDECIQNFNLEESKDEKKMLWVPSFNIDTQLICDNIPKLKDIIIKNNEEKQFKIKEYTELLKISYGVNELNDNGFKYEPNLNEDIMIDKDFIFAISHKNIKNQYNNSIVFLAYITKDNYINSK